MTTPRCCGFRTENNFIDFIGSYEQARVRNWHCVSCGQVHGSKIEHHRSTSQRNTWTLSSGEPDYQDEEVHLGVESFIRQAA